MRMVAANTNKINSVVANPSSMGCQSQRGLGSVKKCLKRGSKTKYKIVKSSLRKKCLVQMGVDGQLAFEANRDCKVCRGRHLQKFGYCVCITHRPHDIRCVKNRATRGLSEFTVIVDKYTKKMASINNMPLSKGHTEGLPSVAQHFGTCATTTTTTTTRRSRNGTTTTMSIGSNKADKDDQQGNKFCTSIVYNMKAASLTNKQVLLLVAENEKFVENVETEDNLEDKLEDNLSKTSGDENVFMEIEYDDDDNRRTKMARQLRAELDDRMSSKDQSRISGCNALAGISHMVHHMMGKFNHRKTKGGVDGRPKTKTAAYLEKQREYRQYFPASEIEFTFPSEAWTTLPSPHYHALQKTSWIHVDWEISHPGATLSCF